MRRRIDPSIIVDWIGAVLDARMMNRAESGASGRMAVDVEAPVDRVELR
jgi:hypothetical protein